MRSKSPTVPLGHEFNHLHSVIAFKSLPAFIFIEWGKKIYIFLFPSLIVIYKAKEKEISELLARSPEWVVKAGIGLVEGEGSVCCSLEAQRDQEALLESCPDFQFNNTRIILNSF